MEYSHMGQNMESVVDMQPVESGNVQIFGSRQRFGEYIPHHVNTSTVHNGGCIVDCGKFCLGLLCLLTCPLFLLCSCFYGCSSFDGRSWLIEYLNKIYLYCCCRFECVTPLSLYELISRYEEDPPPSINMMIKTITTNKLMIAIMETLNIKMPDMFFSFLPTGSLREGFGKVLPSTSILASDFDIMLIPDAIEIGLENTPDKAFSIVRSPQQFNAGYLWLKLNDTFLTQWDQFCLRRFHIDGGYSFLSSRKIKEHLTQVIRTSDEVRSSAQRHYYEKTNDVNITLEESGPATTIKISVLKESKAKCCGMKISEWKRHRMLFHVDFTLGIHCTFWPEEAKSFFDDAYRRSFWPSEEVIQKIKEVNCHVVPKSSIDALVKISLEQEAMTRYGKSPGLEWRFSFSQAEIFLSECIPEAARTAYLALKATNKRHLNNRGRKLKTYPLKCILFYEVEKKHPDYWDGDTKEIVEDFFLVLLKQLSLCFKLEKCPNYWIPMINLFGDGELTSFDCLRKAQLCNEIMKSPKKYVGDNWLEYTRFIRNNCCYCGDSGITTYYEPSGEVGDTRVRQPWACFKKKFEYNAHTCPCGPCDYDRVEFEVY